MHISSSARRTVIAVAALAAIAILRPAPTEACGPWFPNQLLLQPDAAVMAAPTADLMRELAALGAHLVVKGLKANAADEGRQRDLTEEAERNDVKAMLAAQGASAALIERTLSDLADLRKAMRAGSASKQAIPAGLPDELRLYLEGAIAFGAQDLGAARASWESVLALPESERRFRSVWAAFMLGRSWRGTDDVLARHWFKETRELCASGLSDSIGLAVASFGEEALTYLARDQLVEALELYTAQAAHGDPGGVSSVREVARTALTQPKELRRIASDALGQGVMTAFFLSYAYDNLGDAKSQKNRDLERWLKEMERADARKVAGADRLAWLSYRYGRFDLAERWLGRAKKKTTIGKWVRAKLALRAGEIKRAAKLLAEVSKAFPKDEVWDTLDYAHPSTPEGGDFRPAALARAELALIEVSRGEYALAADALLRSGYWLDGAYLAERVLTIKELQKLVDDRWPLPPPETDEHPLTENERTSLQLRELTARRLMRAGRHVEAASYFTSSEAKAAAREIDALTKAADAETKPNERAATLWKLARRWRHGIDVFGTELAPDWTSWGGAFELSDPLAARKAGGKWKLRARKDELRRANKSVPSPDMRWHYRFVGADLAWRAAELMPDGDAHTVEVLCTAGSWLKARAPKEAERFFKAMVKRGGVTALAAAANANNWFPETCTVAPGG